MTIILLVVEYATFVLLLRLKCHTLESLGQKRQICVIYSHLS